MPDDDLYAVLGVAPSATPEEVRRAYRALVRRHHPDTRGTEAEARTARGDAGGEATAGDVALQRVVAAYAVLGDPRARADYDRSRRGQVGQRVEVRRTPARQRAGDGGQPAIRVGPVRWHRSSSR